MMEKLRFVTRFENLNHSTGLQDSKHPIRIWWDSGMNFQPIFFDHGFYLQTNLRLFLSADPLSLPLKSVIIPCLVGMHLHCVSLWIKCNNLTVSQISQTFQVGELNMIQTSDEKSPPECVVGKPMP
jgi:hypothetical protein